MFHPLRMKSGHKGSTSSTPSWGHLAGKSLIFRLNMMSAAFQRTYQQVAEAIRRKILDGKFATGDWLSQESDLADYNLVTRST